MGEGTFVKPMPNKKTSKKNRSMRLATDVPMLLVVAILLIFGLLMVYSASWDASLLIGKPPTYVFSRQVIWTLLGIFVAIIASFIDYHKYEKLLLPMMAGVIGLLILVLVINDVRFNSSRALFAGSIQPAELAKFGIIIYLAFWLYKRKEDLNDISIALIPFIFIIGIVGGLIFIQPDISAAATIFILGIFLLFIAGGDLKQLLLVGVSALVVGGLLVAASTTGKTRIEQYINGLQNPILGSYHIRRTFEAIIKGRIFGVGIGQADTKFTGLPLPHTDSIFAVIAEETGLIGSFFVIAAYGILLWRGMVIAKRAPDQLGSILAFGLTGWIAIEAMMNIAVIVGLFPFTGNALPLISAGGSSMVTTMAALGVVFNVARRSVIDKESERSKQGAVVDMRRRDGRRGVSRSDRNISQK